MSTHYAIGPQEDDAIIRHRLLTRTSVTRGEPPLKKLIKKFIAFAAETEKDADNLAECERLCRGFLGELHTFELPLLKAKTVVDANSREQDSFRSLAQELNDQIEQTQRDIAALKSELEEARVERRHEEECEAIRRLIAAQPPRSGTVAEIEQLSSEIESLERENVGSARTLEMRRKQFALLLHVVDDLQAALDEEGRRKQEQEQQQQAVLVAEDSQGNKTPSPAIAVAAVKGAGVGPETKVVEEGAGARGDAEMAEAAAVSGAAPVDVDMKDPGALGMDQSRGEGGAERVATATAVGSGENLTEGAGGMLVDP